MYFNIDVAKTKRGRICGLCNKHIQQGEKLFEMFNYDKETMKFPIKKNVCLQCANKLIMPEFLIYLRDLYNMLVRNRKIVEGVSHEV